MAHVGTATDGKVLTANGVTAQSSFQSIGTKSGLTDNGVIIGGGTGAFTATAAGTSGLVLMGNTGADPSFQTGGSSFVTTYSTNGGNATPSAAILNVVGGTSAAGTTPVATTGVGNTVTTNVQTSQALAAADATKIGLSNFDSASFAVAATGFVTMTGGGGFTWNDVSGAFSPLKNTGNFVTATATGTLPAAPAQGDTIKFFVDHASQVLTIDAPGTQIIRMGSAVTAAGGTAVSTAQGDSVELVYRTSDTCWCSIGGFSGIWTLT